jgi:hypothetical protein
MTRNFQLNINKRSNRNVTHLAKRECRIILPAGSMAKRMKMHDWLSHEIIFPSLQSDAFLQTNALITKPHKFLQVSVV